jgi:adenine-specific DNA-methyltransferase
VSRLNDLMRQLDASDPALAADLRLEIDALNNRSAFGLNFERHVPEAVELPGRTVRRGDKVRILPPRGGNRKAANNKIWRVTEIRKDAESGRKIATLEAKETDDGAIEGLAEQRHEFVDDLVVVAEFRDPIYPGLVSTGKVERGGDKPFHTVINAENYHALQTLLFTHRGKVDCIYIDPPYNTGSKDWKYNNDYVEGDDLYRHSKWLAMMERRLLIAKELLNPNDSVLIVTIDEKEYLRLGLLLEQVFPNAKRQMVSTVINRKGNTRRGEFSRSEEYLFFVRIGNASVAPWNTEMLTDYKEDSKNNVRWKSLLRLASTGRTTGRFNLFYPIFFHRDDLSYAGVGEAIPDGVDINGVQVPEGCSALWPIQKNGEDGRWSISLPKFKDYISKGYVRFGNKNNGGRTPYYLMESQINAIESEDGTLTVTGRDSDGALVLEAASPQKQPMSIWNQASHSSDLGPVMVKQLLPARDFPYPKSLYAVEDALRFFVRSKPSAVVLDFFAGSGTTAHAVMRLNRRDGGHRQSILVTNNEVSSDEAKSLTKDGLRPGDPDWEARGICDYITKPRIEAAITGRTPDGDPIKGDYKFTDEFAMACGFEENAEFFTLTYEAPLRVATNRDFERIAPLLWMRAGSQGRRIERLPNGWDVAERYGVIVDLDRAKPFVDAITASYTVTHAFIITDEDRLFESLSRELPPGVEPVRLYESYLRNFEIESGRELL